MSEKKIVHELICDSEDVKEDTFRFYSNGLSKKTEFEWMISCIVGKATEHTAAVISYSSFYVYNISDTSSLYWKSFFGGYDNPNIRYPHYFYREAGGETSDEKEFNRITNYYLVVNDSLLLLMQKDYSLLDKFSEYYDR
jgi:hypothetical protein